MNKSQIEGSAVAELQGLTGSGGFSTGHGMIVPFGFEYHFKNNEIKVSETSKNKS